MVWSASILKRGEKCDSFFLLFSLFFSFVLLLAVFFLLLFFPSSLPEVALENCQIYPKIMNLRLILTHPLKPPTRHPFLMQYSQKLDSLKSSNHTVPFSPFSFSREMIPRSVLFVLVLCVFPYEARFLEKLVEWHAPGAETIIEVKRILCIPRGADGVWLVTIADPFQPQPLVIGEIKETAEATMLVVDGSSLAYVADGFGGVLVYDMTNPKVPTRLSSLLMTEGHHVDLLVHCADYLYIFCSSAHSGNSIVVAEVHEEEAVSVGRHALKGRVAAAAQVDDTLLFVATSNRFFLVMDGRKGAHFKMLSITPLDHPATSICAFKEFAFISVKNEVRVYFVSNPEELELAITVPLAFNVNALKWFGGYVFAATEGGLSVIDVRDPRRPFETGFLATPALKKVEVMEFVAYVLTEDDLMLAVDCRNTAGVVHANRTDAPFAEPVAATAQRTSVETFPPLGFDELTLAEGSLAWRDLRESVFLSIPTPLLGAQVFLATSLVKRGFQFKFRCADLVCNAFAFLEHCVPCSTRTDGGLPNILQALGWMPSPCSFKFQLLTGGVVHNTVVFHKQLRRGEVAFVSHLTKDAMFVGLGSTAGDTMCSDIKDSATCAEDKTCAWHALAEVCVPNFSCNAAKQSRKQCQTCGTNELSVITQKDKL